MNVLVTRPAEDGAETAARLRERGHAALIAPLLEVRFRDGSEPIFDGVQAIIVTSANGVRALVRRTARRDVMVFAVGPQSAAVARAAGFFNVKNSEGDATALADAIARWTTPQAGALIHVAGNEASSRLATRLAEHGFVVRREIFYDVVPADLSRDAENALRGGKLDAVLLYSPLSAQIFVHCVQAARLADACRALVAVCISDATKKKCESLPFRELRVAPRPSETEMLDLLAR
jgi:uroporphyrinogen-III synthase